MNNKGNAVTSTIPILVSMLVAGAASSTMMTQDAGDLSDQLQQTVQDSLDTITTHLNIKDALGKYTDNTQGRHIEKIMLLLQPLIETNIDISKITIKLTNTHDTTLISYSGQTAYHDSSAPLFENTLWEQTKNSFSVLALIDDDDSITTYDIMNDDTAFVLINLPPTFSITKDQSLAVSIIPERGITTSIILEIDGFQESTIIDFCQI